MKKWILITLLVAFGAVKGYAAWDSTKPDVTETVATELSDTQANFAAIEAGMAIVAGTTGTSFEVDSDLTNGPGATITETGGVWEGDTANAFEATLIFTDPTADRVITMPNHTGTAAVSGANFDLGAFELRSQTLVLDVATSTAPMTISSTTKVSNLNVDLIDGENPTATFSAATNLYLSGSDGYFAEVVDAGSIKASACDNAEIAASAVHQAELNTAVGSQTGTAQNVEITMNIYSFFPNIYAATTAPTLRAVDDDTDSQVGRFAIGAQDSGGYDVQWRYIASSDLDPSIYVVYNKITGKIEHTWVSEDHPFMDDPNAFPNPFTQFVGDADYEIYLIDNKIVNDLRKKANRNKTMSRVIIEDYQIDLVSIPTFTEKILIEYDEWEDRLGEVIETFDDTKYGKTKTLKRRVVDKLPVEIKYRSLKVK